MQHHRFAAPRVVALLVTVFMGLSGTGVVFAAADATDEQSIDIGAQLYGLYCSECHGVDTGDRFAQAYGAGDVAISEEYAELIDIVRGSNQSAPEVAPVEDWPEWADNPAPMEIVEPDVEAEVVDAMTAAINRVQGSQMDPDAPARWEDEDQPGATRRFDPVPGATNLADPSAYYYGTSEQELYNSIAHGTGAAMPGWRTELGSDEAIWDLVNYVRSLWGEEWLY